VKPLVGTQISNVPVTIQVTLAVVDHVLPAGSLNSKIKLPFSVNVYVSDQRLFVITIHDSLNHVSVAITFDVVCSQDHGLYDIVAVGGILSNVDRYN